MNKEYLYHYTSLQALALILETNSIKFNSLLHMDDIEEKESRGIACAGKYCFVSSWTDDSSESIPMWNLYSNLEGVRITLPKLPFVKYKWIDPLYPEQEIESYFSLEQLKEYDIFPYIPQHDILYKVKYTNDEGKIFPYIKDYVCNGYHIDYEKIGQYKRDIWSFQNEWRYILYIRPVKLSDFLISSQNGKRVYKENILSGANLEISEWFLKLEEESMKNMEILCAPKMSQGDKILLRCLVKEFCSNIKIIESKLKIR